MQDEEGNSKSRQDTSLSPRPRRVAKTENTVGKEASERSRSSSARALDSAQPCLRYVRDSRSVESTCPAPREDSRPPSIRVEEEARDRARTRGVAPVSHLISIRDFAGSSSSFRTYHFLPLARSSHGHVHITLSRRLVISVGASTSPLCRRARRLVGERRRLARTLTHRLLLSALPPPPSSSSSSSSSSSPRRVSCA